MSTAVYQLINLQQRLNTTAAVFQDSLAAKLGLSVKELYTLAMLFDEQAISTGELAERLSITPAGVTKITDKLLARGYIKRVADDGDRRRVLISIDHVDTELIASVAEHYTSQLVKLMGQFSDKEQAVIARYLEEATVLMREQIAEASSESFGDNEGVSSNI
jgi:DNA-binding MarR family transcriptional regulator